MKEGRSKNRKRDKSRQRLEKKLTKNDKRIPGNIPEIFESSRPNKLWNVVFSVFISLRKVFFALLALFY